MSYHDYDAALLRAAEINYGRAIKNDDEHITVSTRTLQRLIRIKFGKTKNRPGRLGYSNEVKARLRTDYIEGMRSIRQLAAKHHVCHATAKRWVDTM